jgi:hypothetical protein
MAKLPPRIKVFRTQIGLNDYVVATSSQQAALEAWDVSRNLFASGEAEITTDPKAIAVALSNIGKAVPMPRAAPKGAVKKAKRNSGEKRSKPSKSKRT